MMSKMSNQAIPQREIIPQELGRSSFHSDVSVWRHLFDFLEGITQYLLVFLGFALMVFAAFFFVYLLIKSVLSYKASGAKGASEQITREVKLVLGFFGSILKKTAGGITGFFNFFWRKKWLLASILLVFFALHLFQRYEVIKIMKVRAGQKAVNVQSEKILNPGIHIISPLFSDFIVSHVANYQFEIPEITADSKEVQDVVLHLNIAFHLEQENLVEFYRREGAISIWNVAQSIVTPKSIEKIKNIVKNYSFKEVHAKQMEIKEEAISVISKALKSRGIVLDDLNIVNIRISSKLTDIFISDEKQKVAEKELEQEKIRSKRELEIAERNKRTKIIEAEAIAESNRLIEAEKVSEKSLELKKLEIKKLTLERWDGKLPQNVGGEFRMTDF